MVPPVVDLPWFLARRDGVVVADVRWYLDGRSGRAAYDEGHLPGAVFVDLDRELAGPPSRLDGRHPLPDPAVFAAAMSAHGIGDADTVVAYDDQGGATAARLVWMLRVTGHDAALLDGGMAAYAGDLEQGAAQRPPARFAARPWPADSVVRLEEATGPPYLLLDARDPDRYRGEREPVDPRAGHIPGARNVPYRQNLDAQGRFRPVEELRRTFAAAGVTRAGDVVSSCGSGVTACHTLLALEHAGLGTGRLYPGSWSQYSGDPERPVAVGGEP